MGVNRYVWGSINRKIGVEGSRFRGAEGKREKSRVQGGKESRSQGLFSLLLSKNTGEKPCNLHQNLRRQLLLSSSSHD